MRQSTLLVFGLLVSELASAGSVLDYIRNHDLNDYAFGLMVSGEQNPYAGAAKIQRLRKQAAVEGYDPNLWLDNVELIAARKIGRETVRYVRNIFKYYVAYRLASDGRELRESLVSSSGR